jgi:hypothetical protein
MRPLRFLLLAIGLTLRPEVLTAQFTGVGGHIGADFDNSSEFLSFGVQGRYRVPNSSWSIVPRFNLLPADGGSVMQIDVDALYNFPRDMNIPIHPYLGVGVGLIRESFGSSSENKAVANLISGVRLVRSTMKFDPFIETHYSFAKEFSNRMTFMIGAIWRIGSASASIRRR